MVVRGPAVEAPPAGLRRRPWRPPGAPLPAPPSSASSRTAVPARSCSGEAEELDEPRGAKGTQDLVGQVVQHEPGGDACGLLVGPDQGAEAGGVQEGDQLQI